MELEHSETLQRLSKILYGDTMSLSVVDPNSLILLTKNARVLKKDTFQQLTKNIRQDKRLSSVPLCWRMANGKLEVLSGNHRVQAAIQAGLANILVMVIEEDLSKAQQIAIQLSHNALVGDDDTTILAELWAAIDDIEAKLYAGLSSDEVERLEKIELVGFSTPQVCTRTMTFAFVDAEAERFNAILDQLEALPAKEMHVADLREFNRFFELLEGVKKSFDVRNSSLAMLKLMDIAETALREHAATVPTNEVAS